ncbi:hypothetical protein IF1G_08076 [Cordyceps javanica]|uniref:Uncharacterized protein n=1 Tax=Cordyceps javanica TaxID=43265 RepID=A0A545UVK8_9HYPO|nr:hypothetical protein IF1G_08076 [Cordyceps javanica]
MYYSDVSTIRGANESTPGHVRNFSHGTAGEPLRPIRVAHWLKTEPSTSGTQHSRILRWLITPYMRQRTVALTFVFMIMLPYYYCPRMDILQIIFSFFRSEMGTGFIERFGRFFYDGGENGCACHFSGRKPPTLGGHGADSTYAHHYCTLPN